MLLFVLGLLWFFLFGRKVSMTSSYREKCFWFCLFACREKKTREILVEGGVPNQTFAFTLPGSIKTLCTSLCRLTEGVFNTLLIGSQVQGIVNYATGDPGNSTPLSGTVSGGSFSIQ